MSYSTFRTGFENNFTPNYNKAINVNSQVTNIETYLNSKTRALVSRNIYSPGISGWVFDIPQNETVELSADITDNYTENNYYL